MNTREPKDTKEKRYKISSDQWQLFFAVLMIGIALLFFDILKSYRLDHSAALYIGLPVLLALGLSLTPKAKSVRGTTMKVLTIALLLSFPLLKEGFICVLMAAPILYGVAALVGASVDRDKRTRDKRLESPYIIFFVALLSTEGIHESLMFDRNNEVVETQIVNTSIEEVRAQLSQPLTFTRPRPLFLRVFPLPTGSEGSGLSVGDQRRLQFVYYKWIFANMHKGEVISEIVAQGENFVRFEVVKDTSYISNYLAWESFEVHWTAVGESTTQVSWKARYQRKLDPSWYFGGLQRYAVALTMRASIDELAARDG